MSRTAAAVLCGVLVAGACSSGSPDPAVTTVPSSVGPTTTTSTAPDVPGPADAADEADAADTTSVSIVVSVDSAGVDAGLAVAIGAAEWDDIDPFTRFSSCSGLRASIGTYSVIAVDSAASSVVTVSLQTTDRVAGPGIHEADVRVEFRDMAPVVAAGTITLHEGMRAGEFRAYEPTGGEVTGTFVCDGLPGAAVPIDGSAESIEVVALLRRDDAERVVGVTLDEAEIAAVGARCASDDVVAGDVLVGFEGAPSIGAINAFELVSGPEPTLALRVGGSVFEPGDVAVTVVADDRSGTFSGVTEDGVAVDGAYRCS